MAILNNPGRLLGKTHRSADLIFGQRPEKKIYLKKHLHWEIMYGDWKANIIDW
jgi:hypothetical protein